MRQLGGNTVPQVGRRLIDRIAQLAGNLPVGGHLDLAGRAFGQVGFEPGDLIRLEGVEGISAQ